MSDPFLTLTNDNILAAFHQGMALQAEGRSADAAALWNRIVHAAPHSAEARLNQGVALIDLFQFAAAEAAFREALRLKPDAPWAPARLAGLLAQTGRWSEAEPLYARAQAMAPGDHRLTLDRAQALLALGRFEDAWPLHEARKEVPGQNANPLPLAGEWKGEPLQGKSILVWPEQGFGDQIQFARFVPELVARGARVTLGATAELAPLFATLGVPVVGHEGQAHLDEPDHWSLIMSLPAGLGTTLETLPTAPWLQVPADRRARWAGFAPKGAVGVAWEGRAVPNPHRSLPGRETLKPLAQAGANLVDLQPPIGDFADLAAIVEQLDLVVTIDTAVAHLAGALGKPCWILLPWYRADWRWMEDRTDSPWYPSARLFRQPRHGDWDSVIADVVQAWTAR